MHDNHDALEAQARHQIQERVTRAAAPRLPHVPARHRLAEQLRRAADRIDL
ncbi:hypothetical protein ACFP3Q_08490 [Nocardioides sp. GCM10027113]|uniref:hypothetical protein n=1 Tax=unclassified Nocardioides TaxID=2615069 RepID=UPI0036184597